jgi:hypothetical protein
MRRSHLLAHHWESDAISLVQGLNGLLDRGIHSLVSDVDINLRAHRHVGGGLAGLVAAIIEKNKGKKVLLIESNNTLGGLLYSEKLNVIILISNSFMKILNLKFDAINL